MTAVTATGDGGLPQALRRRIRAGTFQGPTGTGARGYVQANLVILPSAYADDFRLFCERNPAPCPLLAMGEVGSPNLPTLGADLDVRTDLPAYRVFRDGKETETLADVSSLWRDDLVAFALGCSFSFEEALEAEGLEVRHNALGLVNPMYTTNIATREAGPFRGPMVVTMRPFRPREAIRAIAITARMPKVHGAPVHFGDPGAIGIDDLGKPEFGGDVVPVHDGEVPLFWACGVTPQVAIGFARPPLCITHKPAAMLVTDLRAVDVQTA